MIGRTLRIRALLAGMLVTCASPPLDGQVPRFSHPDVVGYRLTVDGLSRFGAAMKTIRLAGGDGMPVAGSDPTFPEAVAVLDRAPSTRQAITSAGMTTREFPQFTGAPARASSPGSGPASDVVVANGQFVRAHLTAIQAAFSGTLDQPGVGRDARLPGAGGLPVVPAADTTRPPPVVEVPRGTLAMAHHLTDQDPMLPSGHRYDDFSYQMRPGERLVLDLKSEAFDALLRIGRGRGETWRQIAENDDGGEGTNSRLEYRSEASEELVIRVQALNATGRGAYSLQFNDPFRRPLPAWEGTWQQDDAAAGGGRPEILRLRSDGSGEYESRYWTGVARFTYTRVAEDRIEITGLPLRWTASAQRFPRGTIQLSVDRGNGSVGLLPFHRLPGSNRQLPAARPTATENPYVGSWQDAINGGTLQVFPDGRAVITAAGQGGRTVSMGYTRNAEDATLTGYPNATASMRISESGTLFINFVSSSGSAGMRIFHRATR